MLVQAIAFYVFATILVSSALMVITAKNPVHSVLFLILGFFTAAGLFVLLGAEFIAMILIIVYVGAVAVLFLFVVMMLEIDFEDLRKDSMQYVPIGLLIGGVLLFELIMLYTYWQFAPTAIQNTALPIESFGETQNAHALGLVLYTDYIFAFQVSGLILFVAMIGAIVLTHRTRPGIRKQDVAEQHNRKPTDAIEVRKITPGTGA